MRKVSLFFGFVCFLLTPFPPPLFPHSFSSFLASSRKTKTTLYRLNLEAQARYAARAAELKALGGLAPARASALSRLALKTVVKVGVSFFQRRENLKEKNWNAAAVAPLRRLASPFLRVQVLRTRTRDSRELACALKRDIKGLLLRQFATRKKKGSPRNHHDENSQRHQIRQQEAHGQPVVAVEFSPDPATSNLFATVGKNQVRQAVVVVVVVIDWTRAISSSTSRRAD